MDKLDNSQSGERCHSEHSMTGIKTHLYINVHYCICWKSFKLDTETHGSGGEETLCHSPAQVVHRLSGTWPAGTVL